MIGTRGHDLGGMMSPAALAKAARKEGLASIQLVMHKSLEGVGEKSGFLSHGYARNIRRAFEKEEVAIGMIGCYVNLLHDDLERFKECLTYARDIGCPVVGTETGSVNPDYSFNPENHGEDAFQKEVEVVKTLTDYAAHFGTTVAVESVYWHVIHTPERMKRLLDEVDSPNLRVILDPVNYLMIDNYQEVKKYIEKAFELFGPKIVVIHAKDFVVEEGMIKMVPIGQGMMDYDHLYEQIQKYKYDLDVIIEDYRGKDLEDSIEYLEKIEKKYISHGN